MPTDWITALCSVDFRVLADEGTVDNSVFDACDHIDTLSADQTIGGYRGSFHVERAFHSMKTKQIELRPIPL
jgi:transposase